MGKGKEGGAQLCMACGAAACCCCFVVIAICLLGIGIAKIVMGAIHLHDCSIEDMIPIWLIVSGCAPILFGGLVRRNKTDEEEQSTSNPCASICGIIGFLFNLAWLICGSIWVYPNYSKGTANAGNFTLCTVNVTTDCTNGSCDTSLMTFAFAMATIDWIFMGLWIGLIGFLIYTACRVFNVDIDNYEI